MSRPPARRSTISTAIWDLTGGASTASSLHAGRSSDSLVDLRTGYVDAHLRRHDQDGARSASHDGARRHRAHHALPRYDGLPLPAAPGAGAGRARINLRRLPSSSPWLTKARRETPRARPARRPDQLVLVGHATSALSARPAATPPSSTAVGQGDASFAPGMKKPPADGRAGRRADVVLVLPARPAVAHRCYGRGGRPNGADGGVRSAQALPVFPSPSTSATKVARGKIRRSARRPEAQPETSQVGAPSAATGAPPR